MDKKSFPLAIAAFTEKKPRQVEVAQFVTVVKAYSAEEAEGIGHRFARRFYSEDKGYIRYFVHVGMANGVLKPESEWGN